MARGAGNPDRLFLARLLTPYVEAGAANLPSQEVALLEARITRVNPRDLSYRLSSDILDLNKQYVFLPKTAKNDQIPVVSICYDFTQSIPAAKFCLCLNVIKSNSLITLGLRFETGALDPTGALGSHSFAHAQLTSAIDFGYVDTVGDIDCHDTNFASYPAMFGNANNPGDLMLAMLASTYGLSSLLNFVNPTEHWELRRDVVKRLGSMLPVQIAERLPPV